MLTVEFVTLTFDLLTVTVTEFLLVCIVYAVSFLKLPCVRLRYVSCTNKE